MNKCGTTAGYRQHYTNKEKPCDICRLAQKEANANFRKNNKDLCNQLTKKWKLANPDKHKSYKRKSQRKRRSAYSEEYTESDVLSLYGSICYLCNNEIDLLASRQIGSDGWENSLNIDHVLPLAKGGQDILNNVRPTHAICNLKKGSRI